MANTSSASNSWNQSGNTYASWTFRKQAKFFDVVTWSGDDTAQRAIAHNLGSVPGCIIVKCIDASFEADWIVWHRSLATTTSDLVLNTTAAQADYGLFGTTAPTSTNFYLGISGFSNYYNKSGRTYVAYLFAHNAGGFGTAGTDNVITCGSFTADGSGNFSINLGYEAQWVLVKSYDYAQNWYIVDNMRGMPVAVDGFPGTTPTLSPNTTGAEGAAFGIASNATGFFGTLTAAKNYI